MKSYLSILKFISVFSLLFVFFLLPLIALADSDLLLKYISEYNQNALEESLIDGSYRGEEGILRIRPEIADSLGIKVFIDQDYIDSIRLFGQSEQALEKARSAMSSRVKEKSEEDYLQVIVQNLFLHKDSVETAKAKLMAYHSRINIELDDRANHTICYGVMENLIEKSLRKTGGRLRDALGHFYNICQGENSYMFPITHENVRFVNHIFNRFMDEVNDDLLKSFKPDQYSTYKAAQPLVDWREVVEKDAAPFIPHLESALEQTNSIYKVDPLLFLALLKKESSFNPSAVSYVGAAGLTQIMPKTAKDLGMENVFLPPYFDSAMDLLRSERRAEKQAMAAFYNITPENSIQNAKEARRLMQKSLELGRERRRLFRKYKKELLDAREDERLEPKLAIDYGLKYFAKMMRRQNGDISLALASYNAGPSRVKKYMGIPPFEETVTYRNRVLDYYWEYLKKVEGGT